MKNMAQQIQAHLNEIPTFDLELYLELGDKEMKNGNISQSFFWYKSGFEMAKQLKDRGRTQQFSNILSSF